MLVGVQAAQPEYVIVMSRLPGPGARRRRWAAQVHRATLVGGERVVVKVQRPAAEPQIRQDLGQFAEKAGNRPAFQQVADLPAIIGQLSSSLLRELDFRHEAANIERMREVLAPYDRFCVPHVHTDLSTSRPRR